MIYRGGCRAGDIKLRAAAAFCVFRQIVCGSIREAPALRKGEDRRKTMIEVRHLTKKFGKRYALNDISFTAEPGKIYGFLGPNGAGKSTAMNIMTGCLSATSGEVLVDGTDLHKKPRQVKRKIGYLPEVPPLYPEMTVREFLGFAVDLRGIKSADRKQEVEMLLQKVHLQGAADRLIRNLSKGYRQRTGLAMALAGDPEILILDEPSSGLDPEQQKQMFQVIRDLRKQHTVILSSHILPEVSELCDAIWILDQGVLRASGTPEELVRSKTRTITYKLTADGREEAVTAALSGVAHVTGVESSSMENVSSRLYTIRTDTAEDIGGSLSAAVFRAGAQVLGLTHDEVSLTDVFLELTGDGKEKA